MKNKNKKIIIDEIEGGKEEGENENKINNCIYVTLW